MIFIYNIKNMNWHIIWCRGWDKLKFRQMKVREKSGGDLVTKYVSIPFLIFKS